MCVCIWNYIKNYMCVYIYEIMYPPYISLHLLRMLVPTHIFLGGKKATCCIYSSQALETNMDLNSDGFLELK